RRPAPRPADRFRRRTPGGRVSWPWRRTMNHARITALGLAALALSACGYPDFQYRSDSSSSTVSSSSTSGGGGMGGGASSSSSSSTSGAGGGDAGPACKVLHPGGGTCEYTPHKECGCQPSEKCTIDLATNKTKCIAHASTLPWTKCNDDGDCDKGAW